MTLTLSCFTCSRKIALTIDENLILCYALFANNSKLILSIDENLILLYVANDSNIALTN